MYKINPNFGDLENFSKQHELEAKMLMSLTIQFVCQHMIEEIWYGENAHNFFNLTKNLSHLQ